MQRQIKLSIPVIELISGIQPHKCCTGVHKVGTASTAGIGQTIFGWTKCDLDEKMIGLIMARAKKSCLTLANWTFGSLTSDTNTLSNKYLPYCPINIEYCAS